MTTVLIVDDEPDMRAAIARALAAAGYDVLEAGDGFAALALFVERRPQVVITDIYMPDKNGIELVREIRALDPDVKLIAMSGGGATGEFLYLGMVREFGANDVIKKPFRLQELIATIERVLSER